MPGPDRSSSPAPRDGTLSRNKRRRSKRAKPAAGLPPKAQAKRVASATTSNPSSRRVFIEVADACLRIVPPTVGVLVAAEPSLSEPMVPRDAPLTGSGVPATDGRDVPIAHTGQSESPASAATMAEVDSWVASEPDGQAPAAVGNPVQTDDKAVPAQSVPGAELVAIAVTVPSLVLPAIDAVVSPGARQVSLPVRRGRARPVRLALGATLALAGLASVVWFMQLDLSASAARLVEGAIGSSDKAVSRGLRLSLIAADSVQPTEAETLAPLLTAAAHGTDDLVSVAVLPPSRAERSVARNVARTDSLPGSAAPGRKPAEKPLASKAAVLPRGAQSDGGRRDTSRGPILDFLSGVLAD